MVKRFTSDDYLTEHAAGPWVAYKDYSADLNAANERVWELEAALDLLSSRSYERLCKCDEVGDAKAAAIYRDWALMVIDEARRALDAEGGKEDGDAEQAQG